MAVNGKRMSPAALLTEMNRMGGENGIGRVDIVENRYVGMKSRGVYETPGGTILYAAHRAVESITMDREVMHLRDSMMPRYAEMIYNGYWYAPEREVLQKMIDEAQLTVSGTARLKLFKGNCTVVGKKIGRVPLLPRFRHLRRRPGVRSERRRRLHPPERPAAENPLLTEKELRSLFFDCRGGSRTALLFFPPLNEIV